MAGPDSPPFTAGRVPAGICAQSAAANSGSRRLRLGARPSMLYLLRADDASLQEQLLAVHGMFAGGLPAHIDATGIHLPRFHIIGQIYRQDLIANGSDNIRILD